MTARLVRLTKVGLAKEGTPGTYEAPTVSMPWTTIKYSDIIEPLIDESIRSDDDVVHSIAQGAGNSTIDVETNGYADFIGNWFVAMGLFDTVVAGVATTLSSSASAGASSISLTATVPANSVLMLDTGALLEYVQIGTPTGSGPYVCPITAAAGAGNTLLYSHASSAAVASQSVHTFKQNRTYSTVWPTYSFTTDEGVDDSRGFVGCVCSELAVKIDPKGFITLSPKFAGYLSASEADFSYAASTAQPMAGWGWTVTNAGGASTRGLSFDCTFKRAQELIHASTGLQSPREIFDGALEVDGTYKAIFENDTDIALFRGNIQQPTTHTVTQPVTFGGASLAITMSQSGYPTAEVNLGGIYAQLDMSVKGIKNTTDAGVVQVVLSNFVSAAY